MTKVRVDFLSRFSGSRPTKFFEISILRVVHYNYYFVVFIYLCNWTTILFYSFVLLYAEETF